MTNPEQKEPITPIFLSVIIPMFNEEENLARTVDRVAATLKQFKDGPWEIVLVNDGSTDATWKRARELAQQPEYSFLHVFGYENNRGRGYALRTGFVHARGRWIVTIDADLSYEPSHILRMTDVLREESDVDMVVASAYMPGGQVHNVPLKRLFISKAGNLILSRFMSPGGQRIHTITCVVRAYRREVIDNLDLDSVSKDIHLEILSKAIMLGCHVREIPATLRARRRGKSKFRFHKTAISHLFFAVLEKPILLFGIGGVILLLLGMAGLLYIVTLYFKDALNPERPLLILVVLSLLSGFQLISFGVMGMMFVEQRKRIIKIQARLKQIMLREQDRG